MRAVPWLFAPRWRDLQHLQSRSGLARTHPKSSPFTENCCSFVCLFVFNQAAPLPAPARRRCCCCCGSAAAPPREAAPGRREAEVRREPGEQPCDPRSSSSSSSSCSSASFRGLTAWGSCGPSWSPTATWTSAGFTRCRWGPCAVGVGRGGKRRTPPPPYRGGLVGWWG